MGNPEANLSTNLTNAGTLQAVSEYIFRHKMNATSPSTALDDFFGTGMTIVYFLLTSKKKFLHNAYFVDIMVYSTVADLSYVLQCSYLLSKSANEVFHVQGAWILSKRHLLWSIVRPFVL
jgi:hypothetical protein